MYSDQELPVRFPVFPLSGAVLFPHTRLPLNIFEPRYLSLVDAVLAGSRYMGMVQPRKTGRETGPDDTPIYTVGCLGRLTSFAETEDGRYMITLTGVSRFRIIEELPLLDGYRRVNADFSAFNGVLPAQDGASYDRTQFMKTLNAYMKKLGATQNQETFDHADDQALVTAVATSAPFTAQEKQAILECVGLEQQAEMVRSIMQMAAYDGDSDDPGLRH
ncbi:MAG: LON peptidase substrate-binding domain-containing protein [Rhodospirillales bacterium]|nr:LON peptidase substrate-binding domain-containing protein [Rhodospirillales bacterium]